MSNQDMGNMGNNPLDGLQQQAQDAAHDGIDGIAGKIPGGDQFSQQAQDASDSGIASVGQQAKEQEGNVVQEAQEHLPGGLGDKLGGMFGAGHNTPSDSSIPDDPGNQ